MGGEALQFTKKKGNTMIAFQIFYLRKFNSLIIER
jgi:hypothetical protein